MMDDMYRSVYKKKHRNYGGLSISMADRDFQEDEIWGAYDQGHSEGYYPPKRENFSPVQPQNAYKNQRTARSGSLSRMFGSDKNKNYIGKGVQHSVPVSIPDWSKISGHDSSLKDFKKSADEENEDDEGSKLPPHEWLERKHSRNQMWSFSVVEGVGRTLKGRDLSKVRDSVLTRTGFLE